MGMVKGSDFLCVATQDYDAAADFYGNVLGLEFAKRWGSMPAGEFETGNLTIALMQSDAFGIEFRPNNHPLALRVDDGNRVPGRHPRLGRLPPGVLFLS